LHIAQWIFRHAIRIDENTFNSSEKEEQEVTKKGNETANMSQKKSNQTFHLVNSTE
jgi:hypothetical protein